MRIQRIFFVHVREHTLSFGRDEKSDQGLRLRQAFGVRGDAGPRGIQNDTHALIPLVRQERGDRRIRVFGQVAVDVIVIDQAGGYFPRATAATICRFFRRRMLRRSPSTLAGNRR